MADNIALLGRSDHELPLEIRRPRESLCCFMELADQLRNESKLVVGMRRTAADDEAEHLATFGVEPQHPRRPLEPDELQMGEESVHRPRPGTCRAVNGFADTHYIGEATVKSRATGGVFAGSHLPTISSGLAGARKLTVFRRFD